MSRGKSANEYCTIDKKQRPNVSRLYVRYVGFLSRDLNHLADWLCLFSGDCMSGPESAETYNVNGESSNCVTDDFAPCFPNSTECVGKEKTNSVYRVNLT